MKNLTSILITLLFAFNVEGQELNDPGFLAPKDTAALRRIWGGSGTIINLPSITTIQPYTETEAPKIDSVMCIMLITDTASSIVIAERLKMMYTDNGTKIMVHKDSTYLDTMYNAPDLSVKTMIGYNVRQEHCCINGNTGELAYYQPVPYYTHLEYLDDKKQPLSKNIIVWQSINQK